MMNDDLLSQEEIDALLSESQKNDTDNKRACADDILSPMEIDALGEVGNISFGSSATALSALLNQKVEITTPTVSIVRQDELEEEFPKPYVAVLVDYTAGFKGSNLLVIKQSDASIIADLMLGGDGTNVDTEIGDLELSAVQEAMNQMMGSSATSMSTIFKKRVEISPPKLELLNVPKGQGMETLPKDDCIVRVSFRLQVGDLINSSIMQLFTIDFAKELVSDLMKVSGGEITSDEPEEPKKEIYVKQEPFSSDETELAAGEIPSSPLPEQERPREAEKKKKDIRPAAFSEFTPVQETKEERRNLHMLFDIPLQVSVELGRTTKAVKEILELSSG